MANIAIFRINYKSDFILTLNSDAGWMTPFCIKFWTGAPSQAYFVGFDGTTYTHCAPVDGEPTKLRVQFDDHHLPIGDLKFQIAYHFTVADFPTSVEDEVLNQASVIIEVDDAPAQVMLDFNGETAPEIEFSLPAYANEAQRIANEEERIEAEQQRIANEDARIAAEETRQQNEQQRINQETARVNEFATLKSQSQAATRDANDAATLANQKAQLAADKAALADDAATLANQKAQLAADKAALANDAAQLANAKAALAQQKAEYAQQQGGYAKDQGDYAKNQGNYAKEQGDTALADHQRAEADHGIAVDDHTQAGNDHTRAESDHGIAVDDHTQAGNDHTRAESDHGIAVDDHTQAGNDHTRAESDHGIAADDHTQAGNDHTRAESDHTRAESDHAAVEVYVDSLGVFDLSKHNAVGGVLATYADLSAAITALNTLDSKYKYGGMSFKFVLSSDNKYVQYRFMLSTFTAAQFTNIANWQGVDDELTEGSNNLVKSGGVYPLSLKVNGGYNSVVSSHVTTTYIDVALFSELEAGKIYHWSADKSSHLYFRDANAISVGSIPSSSNSTDKDFVMPDLTNAVDCITYQDGSPKDFNFKIQTYVKGLEEKLNEEIERAKDVEDDINSRLPHTLMPLFIGKVVQKDINNGSSSTFPNQLVDSNYYVSMNDYLVVPQRGLRLHIKLPIGMKCKIQGYEKYGNGTVDSGRRAVKENTASVTILENGDIANMQTRIAFYRAKFFYDGTTTPITPEIVQPLIDNGSILIEYETNDAGIISRNSSRETEVKAVMMRNTLTNNTNISVANNHGGFIFIHASDIHGDSLRWKNILDYAQEIGADAVMTTGDYCLDTTKDGLDYFASIAENHPAGDKVIPALGNHDMAKDRTTLETLSESEAFSLVMQPFVTMGNISTDKTYYYKDVECTLDMGDIWNYRIIALNTFDGSNWSKAHIGQQQINFLINALATIPTKTGTQRYGVIIMIHGLEYAATANAAEPLTKIQSAENFFQTKRRNAIKGMHDTPISKIVDAWQSRTTLQTTFTNNDDEEIINIDADFTQVDVAAEFICFVSGHEHYDLIGYNPNTTNLQLVLNVNSAAGLLVPDGYDTLASSGDLPRESKGITQDSFNVCCVDRQNGRIKIMRVGADMNVDLVKRNVCIAPYK